MKELVTIIISSLACHGVWANADLANKHNCLACHAVDKKIVGPSFQEVTKKYVGQPDAEKYLSQSIKVGGVGKWGQMPMPPQVQLSDTDAKSLATWILNGAK
jgi:cytochrome c